LRYCIDIDGTICSQEKDYNNAKPFKKIIKKINKLYDEGHRIDFYTARGTETGIDWMHVTMNQLEKWGAKYHQLRMGKIPYDYIVDDRARRPDEI